MQLYPNLTFDGQCEAALKVYEQLLHGKTVFMMRYEDTPMDLQTPPDWGKKISHATFAHPDFTFHGSDAPPERYRKRKASLYSLISAIQWKPSASSKAWQKTEPFKRRCRKHFGRFASAFSLISSAFHGSSTARSRPETGPYGNTTPISKTPTRLLRSLAATAIAYKQ